MDEKVLKIVTPIIALLTVVFFATFRFMPAIHERYALVVEKREKLFTIAFVYFITYVFAFLENAKQYIICQDF